MLASCKSGQALWALQTPTPALVCIACGIIGMRGQETGGRAWTGGPTLEIAREKNKAAIHTDIFFFFKINE